MNSGFHLPLFRKHPGQMPQNIIKATDVLASTKPGHQSNSHRRGGAQNTKSLPILTDRLRKYSAYKCSLVLAVHGVTPISSPPLPSPTQYGNSDPRLNQPYTLPTTFLRPLYISLDIAPISYQDTSSQLLHLEN